MKHCRYCGKQINDDAGFCVYCGLSTTTRTRRVLKSPFALYAGIVFFVGATLFSVFLLIGKNGSKANSSDLSADEISKITESVVDISCGWDDPNYEVAYGTGTFVRIEGKLVGDKRNVDAIVTNGHVASGEYESKKCKAIFNFSGSKEEYWFEYNQNTSIEKDLIDIAALRFDQNKNTNEIQQEPLFVGDRGYSYCDDKNLPIGSKVYVFGYPSSGAQDADNRNLMVTNGIISGKQSDQYSTTAQIDTGNSGGIAMSKINGKICIVGIPTWISVGDAQILGLVQPFSNVLSSAINWGYFE